MDAAEWLWGVYPYTYLPVWIGYLAAFLAAIVVVWAGFAPKFPSSPAFPENARLQVLISALTLPIFYLGTGGAYPLG